MCGTLSCRGSLAVQKQTGGCEGIARLDNCMCAAEAKVPANRVGGFPMHSAEKFLA